MASSTFRPAGQPTLQPRAVPTTPAQFLYYTLALVAVVAAVCIVSFCYRNVYFPKTFCCKQNQDTESITETEAVVECGAHYANIDSSRLQEFYAVYDPANTTDSTKVKRFLWRGGSGQQLEGGTTQTTTDESPTAIEVDIESRQVASGNLPVHCISVMTTVYPTPREIECTSIINIPCVRITDTVPVGSPNYSATVINQRNLGPSTPNDFDADYLIETQRNVFLLNANFVRLSAANEVQSRRVVRVPHSQRPGGRRDAPMDSMFYSEHYGNCRTPPTRTNDPCAQH